ncbi:Gonadotropin-releasing hormone II receptor [Orchesella cincta]|uniref:Gonadotropin-releasing hormone II receptor n=1 Tax=Orchesella cincta TaxID=48709 RepID=A0A1D2MKK5_ORCCI|nr:Gonadotropin-releasing hormone II receptor [Orchesella cincta]
MESNYSFSSTPAFEEKGCVIVLFAVKSMFEESLAPFGLLPLVEPPPNLLVAGKNARRITSTPADLLTPVEIITQRPVPIDMQFNDGHQLAIILYSLLMILSAAGNITVFSVIVRLSLKGRLSRINLFLLHLTVADLLVTFLIMPLEIGWNSTVSWKAGDEMCRIMSFFRIFGLYLSGFVLMCISLDRYFAIVTPFGTSDANRRAKIMLVFAWFASAVFSVPQVFIFHVETHPEFPWFEQCVTFNFFPGPGVELAYNFFGFFFLYVLPLIVIIFCYFRILYEIHEANKGKRNEDENHTRSNRGTLGRAKIRTLKMTLIMVATFCLCWTPYNVMSLWYWFDKESARAVDQKIQKGLFLFACTNSCFNPVIYGFYHFLPRRNSQNISRRIPNLQCASARSRNYRMQAQRNQDQCGELENEADRNNAENLFTSSSTSSVCVHFHAAAPFPERKSTSQNWETGSIYKIPISRRNTIPANFVYADGNCQMFNVFPQYKWNEQEAGSSVRKWSSEQDDINAKIKAFSYNTV